MSDPRLFIESVELHHRLDVWLSAKFDHSTNTIHALLEWLMPDHHIDLDAPGARTLVRSVNDDMFRFGSAEAYRLGYEAALAEHRDEPESPNIPADRLKQD